MSPFVKTPPPPGGAGLFCQAITGVDSLHWADMGTKTQTGGTRPQGELYGLQNGCTDQWVLF